VPHHEKANIVLLLGSTQETLGILELDPGVVARLGARAAWVLNTASDEVMRMRPV
jgi:hypothetical protein